MLQETDKILYVGFKGKNNSSFKLVDSMKGDHLFLTNSFEGVYRDIDIFKKTIFGIVFQISRLNICVMRHIFVC